MKFAKYHALGNDYLVIEPSEFNSEITKDQVRLVCNRHFGIGADGLLIGSLPTEVADFSLKIINPDGSEADKSGNGLRIFARYLWDKGVVTTKPFTIYTVGGVVTAYVHTENNNVTIDMGQVSFDSEKIPVKGLKREVINERMIIEGQVLRYCAATIGNPHCVVLRSDTTPEEAKFWGEVIEYEPRFPNRVNVQFLTVLDRANIKIEIWERGTGYTLASGTCSCASAAVAYRLGLCDSEITVHMPGGRHFISISEDMQVRLTGPVSFIFSGTSTILD